MADLVVRPPIEDAVIYRCALAAHVTRVDCAIVVHQENDREDSTRLTYDQVPGFGISVVDNSIDRLRLEE